MSKVREWAWVGFMLLLCLLAIVGALAVAEARARHRFEAQRAIDAADWAHEQLRQCREELEEARLREESCQIMLEESINASAGD